MSPVLWVVLGVLLGISASIALGVLLGRRLERVAEAEAEGPWWEVPPAPPAPDWIPEEGPDDEGPLEGAMCPEGCRLLPGAPACEHGWSMTGWAIFGPGGGPVDAP